MSSDSSFRIAYSIRAHKFSNIRSAHCIGLNSHVGVDIGKSGRLDDHATIKSANAKHLLLSSFYDEREALARQATRDVNIMSLIVWLAFLMRQVGLIIINVKLYKKVKFVSRQLC